MANFDKWQDDFNKCVRPDPFEITPWSQSLKFPAFFSWPNPKHICGLHNHPLEALLNKVDGFKSSPNMFWLYGQQHGIKNKPFESYSLLFSRKFWIIDHLKAKTNMTLPFIKWLYFYVKTVYDSLPSGRNFSNLVSICQTNFKVSISTGKSTIVRKTKI